MNVIDMFDYERSSYRRQLKDLYQVLDSIELSHEAGFEKRKLFFRQMRGRFIGVSKLKREMEYEQILHLLEIPRVTSEDIESGAVDLKDRDFFLLGTYLGCVREIPVFLEKLEKAMTPGLREGRNKTKNFLKQQGYGFSDPEDA